MSIDEVVKSTREREKEIFENIRKSHPKVNKVNLISF
jgi:hypothetical protein